MEEEIDCFTDASYSYHNSIAVIACKISTNSIKTIIVEDIKNTQSEIYGINYCINL